MNNQMHGRRSTVAFKRNHSFDDFCSDGFRRARSLWGLLDAGSCFANEPFRFHQGFSGGLSNDSTNCSSSESFQNMACAFKKIESVFPWNPEISFKSVYNILIPL